MLLYELYSQIQLCTASPISLSLFSQCSDFITVIVFFSHHIDKHLSYKKSNNDVKNDATGNDFTNAFQTVFNIAKQHHPHNIM